MLFAVILAFNDRGTLVVEAAPMPRTLSTTSFCLPTIAEAVSLDPMAQQGSRSRRMWFFDTMPYHRDSSLRVDADCRVTLTFRQFYTESHEHDIRWRFEDVAWGGPADFDVDGNVNAFDFLAFQNAFGEGDMACDFDRDGVLTVFDFLAYLNSLT